jgi:uncharacterized RDD family membrane protein YckC
MTAEQVHRGAGLGLPANGAGSLAPSGPRVGAFLIDCIAASLVAGLFVRAAGGSGTSALPGSWSLIPFALDYLLGLTLGGRTVGMYLFGLAVIRVDQPVPIGAWRTLIRTLLLMLLVPAVIFDRDGRGLHDRLTDTAVVRA